MLLSTGSRTPRVLAVAALTRRFHAQTLRYSPTTNVDLSSQAYSELYNAELSDVDRSLDTFARRHIGPSPPEVAKMLQQLGFPDLDEFVEAVVPPNVLVKRQLQVDAPQKGYTEQDMLKNLAQIANKNVYTVKNLIGKGYYGTIMPPVIQRNIMENPEWYTSYTPYQPEISQGRLESLLNFQTVISDLTGLPVANASLLDEGTAAGEALLLSFNAAKKKKKTFIIDTNIHPQTKSVLRTRAKPFGISVVEFDFGSVEQIRETTARLQDPDVAGCLVQYPCTDGAILPVETLQQVANAVHAHNSLFTVASDPLALTLLKPPAEFGADIVLGSTQRLGVPMGFGGPHAAFFAVTEKLNRKIPGRIVGVSKDRLGNFALRLALQTREQHIKRDKATSNICTAQALLANIAANYCVYHGPAGLKKIAQRVFGWTTVLANVIKSPSSPHSLVNTSWFDTLTIRLNPETNSDVFLQKAFKEYNFNIFKVDNQTVSLSLDETINRNDIESLICLFSDRSATTDISSQMLLENSFPRLPTELQRQSPILTNEVFHKYHSETAMLRYLHRLQSRDLSLANSMIPLGSCTMKLNATVEMIPISWPQFANIHPFQPTSQLEGYKALMSSFEKDLCTITGLDGISLQPNSGAQGEYTGLRVIRTYLESIGQGSRDICLVPVSAHGTNPSSSAMCGLKVVPIRCKDDGSLDLVDLEEKSSVYKDRVAAAMITYPSTYGLFEPGIRKAIQIVHSAGGQVYLDGANMNAQVGLTSPGDLGADVCHLNCHKTFAIPHGGGGPAGAPIAVRAHLKPFLPRHDVVEMLTEVGSEQSIDSVSSAPYGNALVIPISYAYIKMLGSKGLPFCSVIAMLNANYMVSRLKEHFDILFINDSSTINYCAHEFIIDLRKYKAAGIEAIDVAKRLQDYGFHAPTLAFPVPDTLMVEPTESENLQELDRFVDSMISIKGEMDAYLAKEPQGAIIKNAPHSLEDLLTANDWETRGYTREQAAYPLPFLKYNKFWPAVARLDDKYGDMNLLCTCPSVEEVANDNIE